MTDIDRVIDDFFLAHGSDAASIKEYNRQYYLRNRKLKGNSPKRVEEDEVPMKSPTGAKLVDFDGKGAGKATYSDGSVYDGNGWSKPGSKASGSAAAAAARRTNNAQRARSNARVNSASTQARLLSAEKKLARARTSAKKLPPDRRKAVLRKLIEAQKSLNRMKKSVFKTETKVKSRVVGKPVIKDVSRFGKPKAVDGRIKDTKRFGNGGRRG